MWTIGSRVKRSDVTEKSILRGVIVDVTIDGTLARVHWDCDTTAEPGFRNAETISRVTE